MVIIQLLVLIAVALADNLCSKFTPNLMKIIDCVNVNRTLVKVIILTRTASPNVYAEDFVNEVMQNLWKLGAPYTLKSYDSQYEFEVIDYSELFAWSGTKFDLRKTQINKTVTYDGLDVAHPTQTTREVASSATILVTESIDVLDEYLVGSARPPFHSPRSIFNIVILQRTKGSESRIPAILGKLWRNYGIVIAILVFTCEDNIVNYVDQFILKPGQTNTSNFDSWGILKKVIVGVNVSLICGRSSENYPKHFNGFPLRVFMFEEDPIAMNWNRFPKSFVNSRLGELRKFNPMTAGYNGLATAGLVEYLNFTPNYKLPEPPNYFKYSFKDEKGIVTGAGEVSYSKFDFVGMLHFVAGRQGMDYDYLNPVYFDKYCVIAPKAKRIPLYLAPRSCFTLSAWFLIFSIPWSSTFFLKMLNYLKPYKEVRLKPSGSYYIVVCFYYVLMSIITSIKTKSPTERWILSGCLSFSIIFMTIFNGTLTTHITTDLRYKEIDTLKDLADSKLNIVTESPFMVKIVFGDVENSNDPIINKLQKKLRLGNDSIYNSALGKHCVVLQKLDFELINNKITSEYGEEKLHLVDECPTSYHTAFLVRRGWPYTSIFNRRIQSLVESGFVGFWKDSSTNALDLETNIKNHKRGIKVRSIQMTVRNSWVWFVAIYVSGFAGMIIFIFENWWYRRGFKKNK